MGRSTEWLPSLWQDTFDDLLYDELEYDHGDQWTLNFSYSQTDTVTKEERKRGWKVYCHRAYGKDICLCALGSVKKYGTKNSGDLCNVIVP